MLHSFLLCIVAEEGNSRLMFSLMVAESWTGTTCKYGIEWGYMKAFHNVHLSVREKLLHVHILSALRVVAHGSGSSGGYLQRIVALRKHSRYFLLHHMLETCQISGVKVSAGSCKI